MVQLENVLPSSRPIVMRACMTQLRPKPMPAPNSCTVIRSHRIQINS
uniref:Uncharacterized protein n=1 Tax=Arundo donax TaxID=35708 RepID=A0A0A8Z2I2_ARUDO